MAATREVYTVCGHIKQLEDKCPPVGKKAGLLNRYNFNRRRPARINTTFLYGFCRPCRDHYGLADRSLDLLDVVLKYWDFKNRNGMAEPVSPELIPAEEIFNNSPAPFLQHAMEVRLETIMLGNQLVLNPVGEPVGDTMRRLEYVRTGTLEWAARPPPPLQCLTIPARSHVLRPVTEDEEKESPPQAHRDAALAALCGGGNGEANPTPDPETISKITATWANITGRLPEADKQEQSSGSQDYQPPASRWSVSTISRRSTCCDPSGDEDMVEEDDKVESDDLESDGKS